MIAGLRVIKTAKSTVVVHLVWHYIYVVSETREQIRVVVYYSARLRRKATAKELEIYASIHTFTTITFPQLSKTTNEECCYSSIVSLI